MELTNLDASREEQRLLISKKMTTALLAVIGTKLIEPNNMLSLTEYAAYLSAMQSSNGNQSQAAKILGISRGTLRTKLKNYFGTTHVGGMWHKEAITFEQALKRIEDISDV